MKCLVIHNADEVKAVFSGSLDDILVKLKKSKYWEDIVSRLYEIEESLISLQHITTLYHDGDSEDGYTLKKLK